MRPILSGLFALALALPARGAETSGEFIYGSVPARQGDVMIVARGDDESAGRVRVRVRFADIVFPQAQHPVAAAAMAAVDDMVLHRGVMVVLHGADADGNRLGTFFFDGENVNEWLVLRGFACPAENNDDKNMPGLLRSAQAVPNGMWRTQAGGCASSLRQ